MKILSKTIIDFDIFVGRVKLKIGLHTAVILVIMEEDIYLLSAKREGVSGKIHV